MNKDIALGMKLRRLLAAFERLDLGEDFPHEPALVEQIKAAHPLGRGENLHEFLANPFRADLVDVGSGFHHRAPSCLFDVEAEHGAEADRAQHPQAIFADAVMGFSDGSEEFGLEIVASADVVDQFVPKRVEEEAVDRKVPALGVFFRRGESDRFGAASIDIEAIRAKGGDLKFGTRFEHADNSKLRAHGDGAREKRLHLFGPRVGGDVIVMWFDPTQHVAHTAAGVERLKTRGLKPRDNRTCTGSKRVGHADNLDADQRAMFSQIARPRHNYCAFFSLGAALEVTFCFAASIFSAIFLGSMSSGFSAMAFCQARKASGTLPIFW